MQTEADAALWFRAPDTPETTDQRRPTLTRQRVVTEALTLIAQEGVPGLTMRALAARLDVVPGALYRHVHSKERLQDLVLDGVLAEVDCDVDGALPWTEQITVLAHRLRAVLSAHPGVAALLTTRDPLGPHSLALAEAFLRPLHAAGLGHQQIGHAYFLIVGYTLGFEVGNTSTSANQQRVHDPATRKQLHQFFRSLPQDRFPTLAALGRHVWLDNHDKRFATGLDILLDGLDKRTSR
ncbi:MAG TPA: TetR/AcrR family transcriptional regulator [Actinophytocola sp.]|uniref:TetR/AcrR family transcriptional regulator n=1 Tax=Actinophytocola sp. TaxID=1872138 RepID=UPI002DC00986|nr:TetR/AcrR family transcriptional regulator [Actinophytocola sp.]HEU5469528.1 TetR/AcrR family transcriptional regulator [Actinophytocola sp.]